MENNNTKKEKTSLFREKSLESIQSPESLNDYLRVTSPGVWLILCAIIALLAGTILWASLGRIRTTADFPVESRSGACTLIVPYALARSAVESGSVDINGESYPIQANVADLTVSFITEETNPYIRVLSGLDIGSPVVELPVEQPASESPSAGWPLPDGIYSGTVVTETLRPISLLLQ